MGTHSAQILVFINDLIFETRIRAAAADAGVAALFAKDAALWGGVLDAEQPALVIIDLNAAGAQVLEAVARARAHSCQPRVVCFVSHVDRELAESARAAGAEVLPRSAFVQQLAAILGELGGSSS